MNEEQKPVKLKRITQGCCGMVEGQVYTAILESGGLYARIQKANGEWTGSHWVNGCFEVADVKAD